MPKQKKTSSNKAATDCNWTTSRYFSFIRSNIRRAWMKFPNNINTKKDAQRPNQSSNKRLKYEYQCSECKNWYQGKHTQVDHIIPCGSLKSYEDLPRFVSTLFCSKENLRVLCSYKKDLFDEMGKPSCHYICTQEERKRSKK